MRSETAPHTARPTKLAMVREVATSAASLAFLPNRLDAMSAAEEMKTTPPTDWPTMKMSTSANSRVRTAWDRVRGS